MNKDSEGETNTFNFRIPEINDSPEVYSLIKNTPPLDLNSEYCYMLQCSYFKNNSIIAESESIIAGFISGYIHPENENVLFVWQVAVHENYRGNGIASSMITELLKRDCHKNITYIETTVTPSNKASSALFHSIAAKLNTSCSINDFFDKDLFINEGHETEELYRIGPFEI